MTVVSVSDQRERVGIGRPHVVLLGAGASLAALPNGDKRGQKPPLMANFISTLGLGPLLRDHGVKAIPDNFETLYSSLHGKPEYQPLLSELERKVYDYFAAFELPDIPTLYDHLLLSLRDQDFIATFNWDPLLVQAYIRNRKVLRELPTMLFLHGSVAVGHCQDHPGKVGPVGFRCPECRNGFVRTPLLFPVEKKEYAASPFIAREWEGVRTVLKDAYMLTVIGYSAPKSDVEAVALLHGAWDSNSSREFLETEVIDVKPEEEVEATWEPFFFSHHYSVHSSFYESTLGTHPRRSGEAVFRRTMLCEWLEEDPFPKHLDFPALYDWVQPFLAPERAPDRKGFDVALPRVVTPPSSVSAEEVGGESGARRAGPGSGVRRITRRRGGSGRSRGKSRRPPR